MTTSSDQPHSQEALRLAATATMGIDSGHGVTRIVLKSGRSESRPAHGYVRHETPLLRKVDLISRRRSRESVVRSLRVMIAGEAGMKALRDERPDPTHLHRSTQFARAWCGSDTDGDELVRQVWYPTLDWLLRHRAVCLDVARKLAESMGLNGSEVRRLWHLHTANG